MATITELTDQQLAHCIYQDCCTVEQLRDLLAQPGVICNGAIDQDRFARVFSDWYQDVPDNVSWVIPYIIADEIHKLL